MTGAQEAGARPWRRDAKGIVIELRVVPNAKAERIDGITLDAAGRPLLLLRIKAPPVDGKANSAVIAFLAKRLGCPRKALDIIAGDTARQKRLRWLEPPDAAESALEALLAGLAKESR